MLNKTGSSSNITQHFKTYHTDVLAHLDPENSESPLAGQQKLARYAQFSGVKREECHRAVAQFLVRDVGRPFELVRRDPFKVMAAKLSEGKYPGVSPDTIRRHIDEMDEQLRDMILKNDMQDILDGTMTIVLDGWSSEYVND